MKIALPFQLYSLTTSLKCFVPHESNFSIDVKIIMSTQRRRFYFYLFEDTPLRIEKYIFFVSIPIRLILSTKINNFIYTKDDEVDEDVAFSYKNNGL